MLDELRRAIFNTGFLLTVMLVFMMYFVDGNQALDEYASVLALLDSITGVGAFTWVVPCVGTLCYAGSYVREHERGFARCIVVRSGLKKYVFRRCAAVFLSAFLAICLAISAYGLYAYTVCGEIFPMELINNYKPYAGLVSFYSLVVEGRYALYMALHIMLHGLAAGMWSIFGLLLSTVWKNNYVALFSPAIVVYFKDFVLDRFSLLPSVTLKSLEMGELHIEGVGRPLILIIGVYLGISLFFTAAVYWRLKRGIADV
jgi:hypothetical protein